MIEGLQLLDWWSAVSSREQRQRLRFERLGWSRHVRKSSFEPLLS